MARVVPIVFLLLAGGIFFGYIHPTFTGVIAVSNEKVKGLDAALVAAKRYEQKIAELGEDLKKLPPDGISRLEVFLPNTVNNVQLILDLDGLAARTGIQIDNFNTTDLPSSVSGADANGQSASFDDGKPYESLDLTITATGSYAQMRSFLSGVETSLGLLDLVSLQISDSPSGVYKYEMSFRLYWLR